MPSSVIHGMLYRPAARTLDIVFRGDRGTYRYFDVDAAEWTAFKRSPSKGTYLNGSFKARQHPYEKLVLRPTEFVSSLAASVETMPGDRPDANVWGFYENTL